MPTAVLVALLGSVVAAVQPTTGEKAREAWQRVPQIIDAMKIGPDSVVADIGAGYGFLTVRLATVVGGSGKVYAVDSGDDALQHLRQRMEDERLSNVVVIAGAPGDPHLPVAAVDAVVVVNAYHEFTFFDDMLGHIRDALKPDGRLVLVEPVPQKAGQTRAEQERDHVIDPDLVVADVTRAGPTVIQKEDRFVKRVDPTGEYYESLVVAQRRPTPRDAFSAAPASVRPRTLAR